MGETTFSADDDEQRELAALRRRAYGPDATIEDDAAALTRLLELEDRRRAERFPDARAPDPPVASSAEGSVSALPAAAPDASAVVVGEAARGPRTARWHSGLIAATAVIAVLLGGAAWGELQGAGDPSPEAARPASVVDESRVAVYESGYRSYIEGMRDEVLALPGTELIADRVIRDRLKPYGILYGRTVGVGPTLDDRRCMIIADLPRSSVTCIPAEDALAAPVSVTLPAWYSDSESNLFTGLGEMVTYTLLPGGSVVALPADSAAESDTAPVTPTPTATAVPPPGWQ